MSNGAIESKEQAHLTEESDCRERLHPWRSGRAHADTTACVPCPSDLKQGVMETLSSNIPDKLAGIQVLAVNRMDGLKLILKDRGWLLIRPSGTEPLLRIYGESAREELLKGILEQGKNLVTEALSQRGR